MLPRVGSVDRVPALSGIGTAFVLVTLAVHLFFACSDMLPISKFSFVQFKLQFLFPERTADSEVKA